MYKKSKDRLLLTTAVTITFALAAPAANAADLTLPNNQVFAGNGNADSTSPLNAAAGDNVNLNGFTLDVSIVATTDDGTDNGTLDVGIVSGAGDLQVTTGGLGGATTDTATIIQGVSNVTGVLITNLDGDNAAIDATIIEGVSTTADFEVTNAETDSAEAIQVTVNGDMAIGGATNINGGAGGAATGLILLGNNDFGNNVVVTGGNGASDEAVLVLSGATTSFNTGLTLNNGAGGLALLEVAGAVEQTITGDIAGTGDISVSNTAEEGAFFSGNVNLGAITVDSDGNDQLVVLGGNVTTTGAIDLGNGSGTDTIILALGNTGTTTIAATGGITDGGSETTVLVAQGGGTITMNSDVNVDDVRVQGNTTFDVNQVLATSAGVTIEDGSTFDVGNGAITSDFTNAGDLNISGSGNITGNVANNGFLLFDGGSTGGIFGNVTGLGTLTVDGNAASISGNVTQGAGEISGNLTVHGNYTVGNTQFDSNSASLTIAANGDMTGNLTAVSPGNGRLIIENNPGTTVLDGNVGSASAAFGEIIVGGGNGVVNLTLLGDLHVASAVEMGDSDNLNFEGTSQTATGILQGLANNQGRVVIGDATNPTTVHFDGTLGGTGNALNAVLINDVAVFNMDGGSGDITTLTVDGTLNMGQDTLIDVNTLAGTGGTIDMTVGKDGAGTDNSSVIASGTQLTADTTAETINGLTTTISVGSGTLSDGDALLIFTSTGAVLGVADADADTIAAEDSSAVFDFEIVRGDNSNVTGGNGAELYAIATRNSVTNITSNTNSQGALNALFDLNGSGGNLDNVIANVNNANSADIDTVLSSVSSTVDGGNVVGATSISNGASDVISFELAGIRDSNNDFGSGVATGEDVVYSGLRPWIQVFGQTGEQDDREGFAGFDVDSFGVTAGVDTQDLIDDTVVGVAFTYGTTEVDSNNATRTQTDIDTYQLTGYFNHNVQPDTYVAGQLSYGFGQNDTVRNNVGGVQGLTARGEFDSHQYNIRGEVGHHIPLQGTMRLTPKASASYLHYSAEDYTETGAGNAGLRVENEDLNVFEVGVGADLSWRYQTETGGILKPAVSAGVRYDVLGEKVETSNRFIAGGNAFKTEGFDPAQTTFDVGVSVEYKTADRISILAEYDYEVKEDYDAHSAALKAMFKF